MSVDNHCELDTKPLTFAQNLPSCILVATRIYNNCASDIALLENIESKIGWPTRNKSIAQEGFE
jgi:hypothetical protein